MVLHFGNMLSPSELVLQWHSFNAGDLSLFQNFNVCDDVTPASVVDGAETAFIESSRGDECDCGR